MIAWFAAQPFIDRRLVSIGERRALWAVERDPRIRPGTKPTPCTLPRLALGLLAALAGRLRRDVDLIEEASFLDVPSRLAKVLLRLAEGAAGGDGMTRSIPTRWTQTELAALVGASRESVNRWIRFYEECRIIGNQDGHIVVLRPHELQKRVE